MSAEKVKEDFPSIVNSIRGKIGQYLERIEDSLRSNLKFNSVLAS